MKRVVEFLGKLINPLGPLGEILSPSVVYKPRQGLPIAAPHSVQAPQTTADISKALQVARTLDADAEVPYSRERVISAFVYEKYTPIYKIPTGSTDFAEIARLAQHPEIIGWKVTQHARQDARARAPMSSEDFIEHVQSLQIPRLADDAFNVYLDFMPGNDPCIIDGQVLRGSPTYDANGKMTHDGVIRKGTQIRGGRREYHQKTKNAIHWDLGFLKKRQAVLDERASRPVRNVQRALEAEKGESLPMWRPTGINFRKDRRSAV